MKFDIIIHQDATDELLQSMIWYNEQKPNLGTRFYKKIKIAISRIEKNPYTFPVKFNPFRAVSVEKFPFIVCYFIDEVAKNIVITAFFHTSRNPEILEKRKP